MEGIAFIPVMDATQPAEARRVAVRMADEAGFTEAARGKLSIVVTEAATNLIKHGGGGQIILRCPGPQGIEVLALDKGPGMRSVAACMRDGYSTAGSPGTGLGAINRMSSRSDIYSIEGKGTVLEAFCGSGHPTEEPATSWDLTQISSPLRGETLCGDIARVRQLGGSVQIMLADGLGHGPLAADAAQAAKRSFESAQGNPQQLIEAIHGALHSTRGAAVAVVEIEPVKQRARYCGVGNIASAIVTGNAIHHMASMNGIVGHQTIRTREFEYAWTAGSVVIMHSDGISGRWQLSGYAGLAARQSSLIAAVLFRDCRKITDDATILVGRQR